MLSKTSLEKNFGNIRGVVYDFENAGDILPKHNHDEGTAHITIVARGRIKAYSHDWETEFECGKLIDFPPEQPHEIMALEDNTRIINIVKNPDINRSDYTNVDEQK
jgi:quercetin dioxygenase-like cupin family protein